MGPAILNSVMYLKRQECLDPRNHQWRLDSGWQVSKTALRQCTEFRFLFKAHALHGVCVSVCVCVTILGRSSAIDGLVSSEKKIHVKSPDSMEVFKNKAPDSSSPNNYTLGNFVVCLCG
jgi:hypothetical protein